MLLSSTTSTRRGPLGSTVPTDDLSSVPPVPTEMVGLVGICAICGELGAESVSGSSCSTVVAMCDQLASGWAVTALGPSGGLCENDNVLPPVVSSEYLRESVRSQGSQRMTIWRENLAAGCAVARRD